MKYFKLYEFDSPDVPNSGVNMDGEFLLKLDKARDIASVPFKITSGYRTEDHNRKVKGVLGSSHTKGYAADIHCNNSVSRFTIVNALLQAGFNRIGIAETFIHVDNDPDKVKDVIWTY